MDVNFAEKIEEIRKVKLEILELQQREHALFNDFLSQLDIVFMNSIKEKVVGGENG